MYVCGRNKGGGWRLCLVDDDGPVAFSIPWRSVLGKMYMNTCVWLCRPSTTFDVECGEFVMLTGGVMTVFFFSFSEIVWVQKCKTKPCCWSFVKKETILF